MTKEELKAKLAKATPEERSMLADALDLDPQASKTDVLKTLTTLVDEIKALREREPAESKRKGGGNSNLFDELFR